MGEARAAKKAAAAEGAEIMGEARAAKKAAAAEGAEMMGKAKAAESTEAIGKAKAAESTEAIGKAKAAGSKGGIGTAGSDEAIGKAQNQTNEKARVVNAAEEGLEAYPEEFPEASEVVVCKITKILNYGVFAELLEYPGLAGFVHISQVASSWIKNIRNFVKENQIKAAKVTAIDRAKGHIDLSFTKVNPSDEKAKLDAWKQLKRAQKLIEAIAKEKKAKPDAAWKNVAEPLLKEHPSLYEAFQAIAVNGEKAAASVPEQWLKPLMSVVSKNVVVPEKVLKGQLAIASYAPNGVEIIKSALASAGTGAKGAKIEIYYSGSGKYSITASSLDYKLAEKVLNTVSGNVISAIAKTGGTAEFKKLEAG